MLGDFMKMLFREAGSDCVLYKSWVFKKFREAGIPLTWNKLLASNLIFEKQSQFPPWAPKRIFTFVFPIKSAQENLDILEDKIILILKERNSVENEAEKVSFRLPIDLNLITKAYHNQISLRDASLFIVGKQFGQSIQGFFYRILNNS